MDRLTESTNCFPLRSTYLGEDYTRIFIGDIIYHHGISLSIISGSGAQFTSTFWRSFEKGLTAKVKLSTIFHPQMDGQEERTIITLEDILRDCINYFKGNWDKNLPFVEFF